MLSLDSGRVPWLTILVVPGALALILVVRPLLATLLPRVAAPTTFTVVAVGMLLSAAGTQLIGLHLIFGAFLFGAICPRSQVGATPGATAGPASGLDVRPAAGLSVVPDAGWCQTEVVDRLTSVGSQLLLPAFFVTAGFDLDLGRLDLAAFGELAAILAVAVGGKLAGAFTAGALHGLPRRQAGELAVLMNARGLTEIVVLSVGLQAGILDHRLYSLMLVMALITTAMTGPLLSAIGTDSSSYKEPSLALERNRSAA